MKPVARFAAALAGGFAAGVAIALAALAGRPGVELPHVKPLPAGSEKGHVAESFFFDVPGDAVLLTHSGKLPFAAFPRTVSLFSEPAVERGLALLVRVKNAEGVVIGFASELEVHPRGQSLLEAAWDTDWTVVLPGRGVLYLHQRERSGALGPVVLQSVLTTGQPWQGDVVIQTTVGPRPDGRGVIVGGVGEFAGAAGSFVEIDQVRRLTPEGALEGTFELRVFREAR